MNSWFELLGNELNDKFISLFKYAMKYTKISYLFSNINLTISKIATLLLYLYGSYEILHNRLTIGDFTIISAYFGILLSTTAYFINLGKSYQDALVCYNRITEILYTNQEINGRQHLKQITHIQVSNLNFSYENKKILHKFNCNFELGKIYCIVGENGCGKSTLINIITGLLYNYSGDVYYNGKNIKDIDMYSLRKENIAVTEQEPRLINNTLKNNIIYGINKYHLRDIIHWCKILNIYDFIDNQSKKFDEMVNEKSNNISGGEKQKISLIRTFIKNSNVIILDEPTSALDKNTVGSLKEVLVNIKRHKIIIFVTHEDNILSIADEIIKIKSPTMSENI